MAVPRFWREMPVRYNLIGSHCTGCDMYHYPPRAMCSGCHRESLGKMEEHQFAGTGQIVACTVVYQPQQGYEMHGPYPMAMIEMDEGARITAQIVDVAPEMVKRGMRVKAVFRKHHLLRYQVHSGRGTGARGRGRGIGRFSRSRALDLPPVLQHFAAAPRLD